MQGSATAAGQIAAAGLNGHVPDLAPASYDPAMAKGLLAEAGYSQGLTFALTCTNDRFAGDCRACQTVAQMLNAVGIRAKVDAKPAALYFRRWATIGPDDASDFTATISMFGSTSGLASEGLDSTVRTTDGSVANSR
jgi:peptide/nickel transport system substrate-binding protein